MHSTLGSELRRVGQELERLAQLGHHAVTLGASHTEPTTHEDLNEILRTASTLGFKRVCLCTSGVNLASRDRVDQLKRLGVSDVVVTIPCLDSTLGDVLLGRRGATNAKTQAIQNALAAGLGVVAALPLLRCNLHSLAQDAREIRALSGRRRLLQVRAFVVEVVAETPRERFEVLWPRYDEIAWALHQVRKHDSGFVAEARVVPLCVAEALELQLTSAPPPHLPNVYLKPVEVCGACSKQGQCKGIDTQYWRSYGGSLDCTRGQRPPPIDPRELAQLLLKEKPLAEPGLAEPEPWQREVAQQLSRYSPGKTALHSYHLAELVHQPKRLTMHWHSAIGPLQLVVQPKDSAPRFFVAGDRFCVSYASSTPPTTSQAQYLINEILALVERTSPTSNIE